MCVAGPHKPFKVRLSGSPFARCETFPSTPYRVTVPRYWYDSDVQEVLLQWDYGSTNAGGGP
jgi:hypothetical protein